MKKLFLLMAISCSLSAFSQSDSAKLTPSITLQGRDIEYLLFRTGVETKYEKLDSVLITKVSGSNLVSGTTTTSIDGVQARHWISLFETLRNDPVAQDQGIFVRIKSALNASTHTWLTSRITVSDAVYQNLQQETRQYGRKRARKELDEQ